MMIRVPLRAGTGGDDDGLCGRGDTTMTADLTFLTREGCVQSARMRDNLDGALKAANLPLNYRVVDLDQVDTTDARRGYPTPTLLYKNHDVFGCPAPTPPFPDPT